MAELLTVRDQAELDLLLGTPAPRSAGKIRRELSELDRRYISHAPICLVATAAADGSCDVSPKGDPPGFAYCPDARTLVLPDRPGSRRGDGFRNVLSNPHVGLLFLIPRRVDALRVNGRALVVKDAPYFDDLRLDGARPMLALHVDVEEVFLHHSRAFNRSGLWDPASWTRVDLPDEASLGRALEPG